MSRKKAAIIVVGDEILKGQTIDSNSHFIAKRLFSWGVKVSRIVVVADEVEDIAEEVRTSAQRYDYVITCGGVGPTHDDVTYAGVAKALNQNLKPHSEMTKVIQRFSPSIHAQKMALLPESAELMAVPLTSFPIVRVGNVFNLPGVPKWCESGFLSLQSTLMSPDVTCFVQNINVLADELSILPAINETVQRYKGTVIVGSYPGTTSDGTIYTRLTLESCDLDTVCASRAFLMDMIPSYLMKPALALDDARKILDLANGSSSFSLAVAQSIKVVEEALKKYSSHEVYLSFNGGKDCTVLLHLVWALSSLAENKSIPTLFVQSKNPFPDLTVFIDECVKRYELKLNTFVGPIKSALEDLISQVPETKAVWMGTRRTDPYSKNLEPFQMCDEGWPKIMRISPLLDWSYDDVWTYLRLLGVPYCKLYDEGYTSLGNMTNTVKNPALFDQASNTYLPAYKLQNGDLEREGRQ